jgi:DNA-binding transcriptional MocR family regulator
VAGDDQTIARIAGRHRLGAGWVSRLLQELVATLLEGDDTHRWRADAAAVYTQRRGELVTALDAVGVTGRGESGLNVWVPVADESDVMARLLEAGWAVAAGQRYRIDSPPGIRVTIATLEPGEADRFAADLARCLTPGRPHYTG